MFCCHNKLSEYGKLGKCLSHCTDSHEITDICSACITYVYTKHKWRKWKFFTESFKMAIPKNTLGKVLLAVKVVRKIYEKVDIINLE